ncbi:diguanylate cyclase with PAS/PAC sensor [Citrifermentans bremense]|uniref:Diguanylate cyclase with PAS/PAC sensor n=1 Tax=Citrifermentans bremense TaxID=60035 RepID=A0A6S6LWW6_9BACT|nr:diguanylate cyclase [Citrifermentans bremense]BCG46133.1 diguanylate cyclase with PAS/PAC sensor [Citrifermentans bremense]
MLGVSSDKLLNSLFDGLYCVDLDRRISFWNSAAQRITGYSAEEVLGSKCHDSILRHMEIDGYDCEVRSPLSATMEDGKVREANVLVHHKHGYRLPVQVRTSPVRDEEGAIVGAVQIFTDNSNAVQILAALEKLKQDVLVDSLTGVGNRRLADMSLDSRLHDWQTHYRSFGVLFMDVDHFKSINDRYGHKTGDDVLRMVGKTVSSVFRKVDTVARWGGEEFVAILPSIRLPALATIAERVRTAVARSFLMEGGERIGVTLSIGGTIAESGDTAESIITRADAQMYRSKACGRNLVTLR